jgi:hypothetical protein
LILLDENILEGQRLLLEARRIAPRQIGVEVARKGLKDEQIIPLLRRLRNPTFITRDLEFYDPGLRHRGYCLVVANIGQSEVAAFVRRFLRHPEFRTQSQRMGTVARMSQTGIICWRLGVSREGALGWSR